jgi:UDP-glucose 4-epimerase
MRVLVTGGAGFLGSALSNQLARVGHTVLVIDDLSAGDPARLHQAVLFSRGDVRDVPKLWTLLQGVDCVFHLAARVRVSESILYPREYNDANVGGTVALLEAVRDAGVRRVVFASSGAVYGEQSSQPVQETCLPQPDSPYGVSKIAAEHYLFTLGTLYGIETVALRIFNVYGPGQFLPASHPPVVPQFMHQALGGGSLVIFGDGAQTRDFVYVDDAVDALAAAATAEGIDRMLINVGTGRDVSINHLAELVAGTTGKPVSVLHNRAQSGGVSRLVADIERARQKLGFSPQVGLEEGLRRLLREDPRFSAA